MPNPSSELVKEQYQLRSPFFVNQLDSLGFFDLFSMMQNLVETVGPTLDWQPRSAWHIQEAAWNGITMQFPGQELLYFVHPNIIAANPSAIRYYRCVNLLPIKGLQRVGSLSGIDAVERGKRKPSDAQATKLIQVLNENMSFMMQIAHADQERLKGMMFATAGTTIDGSWRNKIGAEGERVIRALITAALQQGGHINAVGYLDNKTKLIKDIDGTDLADHVTEIRHLTCTNGSQIIFGSEPDLELRSADGTVIGGVEIKAGLDPAGALERLGAMLKSFESIIAKDPGAETILIASCITDEVQNRLNTAKTVSKIYILTDIINNVKSKQKVLINEIMMILGLIQRRS